MTKSSINYTDDEINKCNGKEHPDSIKDWIDFRITAFMFCPLKHFVFRKYFDGEVEPRQIYDFKSPHGAIYGLSRRSSGSVRTTDGAIIKHQGVDQADSWTWICEWRKMKDKSGPSIFIDMPFSLAGNQYSWGRVS